GAPAPDDRRRRMGPRRRQGTTGRRRRANVAWVLPGDCLAWAAAGTGCRYCSFSTTTDLAGSSTRSVPPDSEAPSKATGRTCSGGSKLLCAVIAPAVSTRPERLAACSPDTLADTLAALSGSRLDSAT